jgi:hypothetical protein
MEAKGRDKQQHERPAKQFDKYGNRIDKEGHDYVQWLRDSVQRLIGAGHRLSDIAEYPLDRFVSMLAAVNRAEARERVTFVTDMSAVVGGMFGGGDSLSEHIEALNDVINGE